jgi:hypothetical protein
MSTLCTCTRLPSSDCLVHAKPTKRELFAAMAFQAVYAKHVSENHFIDVDTIAKSAVECADALIEELNK